VQPEHLAKKAEQHADSQDIAHDSAAADDKEKHGHQNAPYKTHRGRGGKDLGSYEQHDRPPRKVYKEGPQRQDQDNHGQQKMVYKKKKQEYADSKGEATAKQATAKKTD